MSRLYLVTGFLGAGKTTFLKKLIRELSHEKLHIIVNEFGKEGIDGQLLREIGMAVDEINNGSIFCACRLDKFEEVLTHALAGKPDVILVEASGLSNPVNVKKILSQPGKFEDAEYMGSICLVDAVRFFKVYETASVVKKQLSVSDIFILNKTDLAEKEQIQKVKETLHLHRPGVPVFETSYGELRREWLETVIHPVTDEGESIMQSMDITLRKCQITLNDNFTLPRFRRFVEMFLEDTYRVKGFVRMEGKMYLTDCVGNLFKAEEYHGQAEHPNVLIVLYGNGLPAKKSIQKAMEWYHDEVKEADYG